MSQESDPRKPVIIEVRMSEDNAFDVLRVTVPEEHRTFSNCYQHGFRAALWGEKSAPQSHYDDTAAWKAYQAGYIAGQRARGTKRKGKRSPVTAQSTLSLFDEGETS